MAKSLRSKRGRKMRNIKRERYGKKELIRLKKMLGLPIEDDSTDIAMANGNEGTDNEKVLSAKERRIIDSMVREGVQDCSDSEDEKQIEAVTSEIIVLTTSRKVRQENRIKKQKEEDEKLTNAMDSGEGERKRRAREKEEAAQKPVVDENLEKDQVRIFNSKTLRDQHGNYPIWMNQKKMRTLAKTNRKSKKKTLKRLGQPIKTVRERDSKSQCDEEFKDCESSDEEMELDEDVVEKIEEIVNKRIADVQPEMTRRVTRQQGLKK